MKNTITILAFTIASSTTGIAQEVKCLTIVYDVTYPNKKPMPMLESLCFNKSTTIMHGNKSLSKAFTESADNIQTFVSLDCNETVFSSLPNQTILLKTTKSDYLNKPNTVITVMDETKQILGYTCKKVKKETKLNTATLTNYYYIYENNNTGYCSNSISCLSLGINGLMLGCEEDLSGGAIQVFSAISMSEELVDSTVFIIPQNYTTLTHSEYQQKLSTDKEFRDHILSAYKIDNGDKLNAALQEQIKQIKKQARREIWNELALEVIKGGQEFQATTQFYKNPNKQTFGDYTNVVKNNISLSPTEAIKANSKIEESTNKSGNNSVMDALNKGQKNIDDIAKKYPQKNNTTAINPSVSPANSTGNANNNAGQTNNNTDKPCEWCQQKNCVSVDGIWQGGNQDIAATNVTNNTDVVVTFVLWVQCANGKWESYSGVLQPRASNSFATLYASKSSKTRIYAYYGYERGAACQSPNPNNTQIPFPNNNNSGSQSFNSTSNLNNNNNIIIITNNTNSKSSNNLNSQSNVNYSSNNNNSNNQISTPVNNNSSTNVNSNQNNNGVPNTPTPKPQINMATQCGMGCNWIEVKMKNDGDNLCGNSNDYRYSIINNTLDVIDFTLYYEKANGSWEAGGEWDNIVSGAVLNNATWSCNVTMRYDIYYRISGSLDRFPTSNEINKWIKK